jgi:1,4-alpha-glucan branching enzyme
VPDSGRFTELLNSDDVRYGGSGVRNAERATDGIAAHGRPQSLELDLPPLATVILQLNSD